MSKNVKKPEIWENRRNPGLRAGSRKNAKMEHLQEGSKKPKTFAEMFGEIPDFSGSTGENLTLFYTFFNKINKKYSFYYHYKIYVTL